MDDPKVTRIILNYINILYTLGPLRTLKIFISKCLDAIYEQNLRSNKTVVNGVICTLFLFGLMQTVGGLAVVSNVWAENDDDDDNPSQLGDLEGTAQNRGKNVQGDLLQGTINNCCAVSEVIEGTDRSETIMGLQANDIIYGKGGDDIIYGDEDDDLLYGGAGDDLLNGGAGDNKLDGEGRNDILIGGEANDILSGGDGNDKLFGFLGSDVLKGGEGSNEFNCGEGIDTVLDYKESRDLLSNDCEIVHAI